MSGFYFNAFILIAVIFFVAFFGRWLGFLLSFRNKVGKQFEVINPKDGTVCCYRLIRFRYLCIPEWLNVQSGEVKLGVANIIVM